MQCMQCMRVGLLACMFVFVFMQARAGDIEILQVFWVELIG
jgi:hypothetical protein